MSMMKDPKIVLYVVAVLVALLLIIPMPSEDGFKSRLKYGLDLEGGSWLQLELQGAIVQLDVSPVSILKYQFETAGPVTDINERSGGYMITIANGDVPDTIAEDLGYPGSRVTSRGNITRVTISASEQYIVSNYLESKLDTDVQAVSVEPIRYEIRTNVTEDELNSLLAPVDGRVSSDKDAFTPGLTEDTVDETKEVLDKKLNRLGLQDIKVRVVDNQYILIDLAGVNVSTAEEVVGKPGKFEIRIKTTGNDTRHVVYGDAVQSVDLPQGDRDNMWGVPFVLSESGAQDFQRIAKEEGATKNPTAHDISMYLDKEEIFSAPLATDLASSLDKAPMRNLVARVGSGDEGSQKAKELYIHLREGALPVNVKVIGSGQVTASLGSEFKRQVAIAGIIAILAVGLMIFYRYREKKIVLPMVATSFSEVIMMLGVWAAMGWQLDLSSIAGIIMVIGTGVDHLFIITDELLTGEAKKERVDTSDMKSMILKGKVYIARLGRAFYIILGAATTTVAAMIPLLWMGFGALTGFALITIIGVLIGVGIARPAYGRAIGYILGEE